MNTEDGGQTPQPEQTEPEQGASPGPKPPPGARNSTEPPPGVRNRRPGLAVAAGLSGVVALVAAIALSTPSQAVLATASGTNAKPDGGADAEQVVAPQGVTADQLAALPQATTFGTVAGAPADPAPTQHTAGRIAHPSATVAVYASPGGPAIAALPPQQPFGEHYELKTDTNLPIVAEQPGWAQVLLPSRPNSSTGWIYLDDPVISPEHSRFRIVVDRARYTLTLFENDTPIGHWMIGVGKTDSVTPAGRTFILSSILDAHPTFSRIIMPLGAHSDTYSTYGGGPGTVAIHTWPTPSVYGRASSDGCIRVPPDALDVISSTVPLGSVVEIT